MLWDAIMQQGDLVFILFLSFVSVLQATTRWTQLPLVAAVATRPLVALRREGDDKGAGTRNSALRC